MVTGLLHVQQGKDVTPVWFSCSQRSITWLPWKNQKARDLAGNLVITSPRHAWPMRVSSNFLHPFPRRFPFFSTQLALDCALKPRQCAGLCKERRQSERSGGAWVGWDKNTRAVVTQAEPDLSHEWHKGPWFSENRENTFGVGMASWRRWHLRWTESWQWIQKRRESEVWLWESARIQCAMGGRRQSESEFWGQFQALCI